MEMSVAGGRKAELETLLVLMKLKSTTHEASKLMLLCPNRSFFFFFFNLYVKVYNMVILHIHTYVK